MLAAIHSAAVQGIDAIDVTVEVDVALGLPAWTMVGLPGSEVKESRERVCSALANSGLPLPPRRLTVNLSPADIRKSGTAFDLPMALGLLVALGIVPEARTRELLVVGELGLDGTVRPVRGILPIAASAAGRREGDRPTLVLPPGNVAEARLVRALPIVAPPTLRALVEWLQGGEEPPLPEPCTPGAQEPPLDLSDVVGQAGARRALEIAAAGAHACLLVGPPGAGKTMLARRLPGILPPLEEREALEVTAIHSVAGLVQAGAPMLPGRPFRAPHHSVSGAGLIGGGSVPRPGEVSLAHLGVLFLDELLEFPRHVLESLRQPMEDGRVVIARAASSVAFPARFSLVAAMNPCPCGNAGEPTRECRCAHADVLRYRNRLSGPLADRIDMHVTLAPVPLGALSRSGDSESSAEVRVRVMAARERQRRRHAALGGAGSDAPPNAHVPGRWLDRHGCLRSDARALLASAAERLQLSARGYHRVLKVARTIADLAGDEGIAELHVAEALRYRPMAGPVSHVTRNGQVQPSSIAPLAAT